MRTTIEIRLDPDYTVVSNKDTVAVSANVRTIKMDNKQIFPAVDIPNRQLPYPIGTVVWNKQNSDLANRVVVAVNDTTGLFKVSGFDSWYDRSTWGDMGIQVAL